MKGKKINETLYEETRKHLYANGENPDEKTEITRLGTKDWLNSKNFVKEKVLEIANDLLDLYAKRQVTPGFAFSKDSIWMKDLEGAFPFEETEDQKIAIRKVKEDMESPSAW